jgi:pimeloyl-ACP methyl ester carboxylesterase
VVAPERHEESEVREALAKLQKKARGADPLAFPADIGAALWMSKDYKKARVKKGKVETSEAEVFGSEFEYTTWTPNDYNPGKNAYPLLLCIPDQGQAPQTHLIEDWVSAEIRDNCIVAVSGMPDDPALWGQSGEPGNPGGVAFVLTTFKQVMDSFAIDFDRVFLVGKGRGVAAATAIAEMFPDRFAGVVGRGGGPEKVLPNNFRNLPTLFAGADASATEFQSSTAELGYENCSLLPEGKEVDVWGWMSELRRVANPAEVTLVPGTPFPKRAYWVEVPPLDDATRSARVTARIERETNTIRIEARGVPTVTVLFNDVLVNLDEPVHVGVNGVESVDQIPRDVVRTLDMILTATNDPGRIYVATKGYNVAAPAEEAEGK